MSTAVAELGKMESLLICGDLSKVSEAERVEYYKATCNSMGLNPLTRPFEYVTLNGKMTLYARKACTDQLRAIHKISVDKPEIKFEGDQIIVMVTARDRDGREDSDIGVVNKNSMGGDFGNALMKAITKAKRRVTLSLCGLGMLDETEVETIPGARPVIHQTQPVALPPKQSKAEPPTPEQLERQDAIDRLDKAKKTAWRKKVINAESWTQALADFGATSVDELTVHQIHEFAGSIENAMQAETVPA